MDYSLFQIINGLAGQFFGLDKLGIFFAKYFEYILIILAIFILRKKLKVILQAFGAAVLARLGITELIRWVWEKPRPFMENNVNLLLEHNSNPAFPSGHAAFYFALATVIYFYNQKAGIFFFIAAFLISISRVFVGIHWPSDILAGAIVGILSGFVIMKFWRR